jgi:hypothetical protein
MATRKIKCGACGFAALLFTTGESIRLTVDSAKQSQLCNYLKEQPKSSSRRVGALDCLNFREAMDGPTKSNNSGAPTLDETENEAVGAEEAAPENASTKSSARSRRSRRAEVAETGVGSPKAKSAGRAPRKSTRQRKIDSDAPIVADGEPMVS